MSRRSGRLARSATGVDSAAAALTGGEAAAGRAGLTVAQFDLNVADLQAELREMFRGLDQLDDAQQVVVGEVLVSQPNLRSTYAPAV